MNMRMWIALSGLFLTLDSTLATTVRGLYTGTIVDWPPGVPGEVSLDFPGGVHLARGLIDAQGHFSVLLPPAPSDLPSLEGYFDPKSTLDPACIGHGTAAPETARIQWFVLNASIGGTLRGDLQLSSSSTTPAPVGTLSSQLVFFDTPVTMNGTLTCPNVIDTYQGRFEAGWNFPLIKAVPSPTPGTVAETITSGALPTNLAWRLYSELVATGLRFSVPAAEQRGVVINLVVPGAPAAAAGLLAGDTVIEVDGHDVSILPMAEVLSLIRGKAGTRVTLGVVRAGSSDIRRFTITRALVRVP